MQQASGNQRAVAVVTAVAAALFLGHALFFWPTWVDDAYITFRHSRNLWHGDGLVFNPGQRVEGLTDLAWGVLLAPFSEHDPMFVAKVLGLLSSLGTVGLVGGWAHAEGLGPRGAAAALAPLVLAPWAPYWAVQGLETPVVMLLVTLAWTRYRREADGRSPWPLVALGAGAAPAFRPDSAVLALLLGAWYLLRPGRRLSRRVLTSAALVIALAAALLCTKIAWYGAILPLTWQAKRAPWPHLAGWHYLAALFQGPWPPFAIILGIATAFSLASLRKRDERALPGLVVLAWAAVAVVSNGDYFASWRLLVPALRVARDAARSAACASSLRQLHLANLAYSGDAAGGFAPGAARFDRNLDRWFGTRPSVREPFEPRGGPLSPHLGPEGAVRQCPSFKPGPVVPGLDFEAGCGGYGYNNAYVGVSESGDDAIGVRLSSIRQPEATVMFADTALAMSVPSLRIIEYSFAEAPLQRDSPYPLDPSIHFRHAGLANIAWADGHVARERLSQTRGNIYGVNETQMRDLQIGWFGPANNRFFDLQ